MAFPVAGVAAERWIPSVSARRWFVHVAGNALPLALSAGIASALLWGPFTAPTILALAIVAFAAYWVARSYSVAVAVLIGLRRIRTWTQRDWQGAYDGPVPWDWPRHVVIIPNYREAEEGLALTIESLVAQENRRQIIVVLAMEQRETGAETKAARLIARFGSNFADMFATFHPPGIPGEAPGKGSNEAWAARAAYRRLIADGGDDINRYTISSCDADARFHPRHFEALNALFLGNENRYRAFWQPAIFNTNNIWETAAVLRIAEGLVGLNKLANLVLPSSVTFPTSCYALSWAMLHEVDYWDEEVIPEDWHIYLKCIYTLGDPVHVVPMFIPVGNDCVQAGSPLKTLFARYRQAVRHAWGSSDIPYAWRSVAARSSPASLRRRVLMASTLTKVHVLWASQWSLITLGWTVPAFLSAHLGGRMPGWWLARDITLPGPAWRFADIARADVSTVVQPTVTVSLTGALLYLCLVPLLVLVAIELRLRGPRPATMSWLSYAAQPLVWLLMPVVTLLFSSLPAWSAQLRLASGRELVYRVAEKGSRAWAQAPADEDTPRAA